MTNQNLKVKKSKNWEGAFEIVKSLPEFFRKDGWSKIKKDLKNDQIFYCLNKREVLGFVSYKETNKDVVEASWAAVKKEFQGKGVGQILFSKSLKKLSKKYQFCKIRTLAGSRTDKGYERTRNFYKKLGFYSIEIIDPYPGWSPGNPCEIMVKFLRD